MDPGFRQDDGSGDVMTDPTPDPHKRRSWHDSVPFPRHWRAYIALKLAVLALAVYFVLYFMGFI
jgi:hypothetical protein